MPPKKVKRADGRYQVSIVTGRTEAGKPVKKYFYGKTQKEANQKRDEYLEGIAVSTDARTMTVRRWANRMSVEAQSPCKFAILSRNSATSDSEGRAFESCMARQEQNP